MFAIFSIPPPYPPGSNNLLSCNHVCCNPNRVGATLVYLRNVILAEETMMA